MGRLLVLVALLSAAHAVAQGDAGAAKIQLEFRTTRARLVRVGKQPGAEIAASKWKDGVLTVRVTARLFCIDAPKSGSFEMEGDDKLVLTYEIDDRSRTARCRENAYTDWTLTYRLTGLQGEPAEILVRPGA